MAADVILNPELLGVDVATGTNGDLLAEGSDLMGVGGVANAINAFVRELTTPYGYLARWVADAGGLKILDEGYGNPAFYQMSQPTTQEWIDFMIDSIEQVADNQSRIELTGGISYTLLTGVPHGVRFRVPFRVLGVPKDFNLVLTREGAGLRASLEG